MHSSSNIHLDNCSAEHLYTIQLAQSSNSDASGISMLLHEDITCKGIVPENTHHISNTLGSCLRSCSQAELQKNAPHGNTIGHLSARRHSSPTANAYGPHEWTLSSGHQVKRARVENIIKEMTGFPNSMHFTDVITRKNQHEESDNTQENTKTRELPYQHSPAGGTGCIHHWNQQNATVSTLLQSRHKPLGNLRTRLTQEDAGLVSEEVHDEEGNGNSLTWNASPKTFEKDTSYQYNECVGHASKKDHGGKKLKLMNYLQSKPDKVNTLMADILKYELSRAVSMSVDSIFKKTQPERSPCMNSEKTNNFNQSSLTQQFISENNNSRRSCYNTQGVQIPAAQTEALSLVVHKPVQAKSCTANLLTVRAHRHPTHPFPNQHIALQEDQGSKRVPNAPQHINALRSLQDGYTGEGQPKLLDVSWNSVKVRSKVNSKSVQSSQMAIPVDPMFLETLCPHIKIESDDLQSIINNPLTLNDGLTTNHLKKAKLMFFYTRYPSSLVLKTIFHDVQFTRCITSQLIKWFSNFREFYYIQMEKYARHAITEGAANMRSLTVGRESELFRALNMHYNKANDFQVPDRFLEVSEITLREFYIAISMGKDSDPSWKKAIYKVICKLDSEVPDEFKSPL